MSDAEHGPLEPPISLNAARGRSLARFLAAKLPADIESAGGNAIVTPFETDFPLVIRVTVNELLDVAINTELRAAFLNCTPEALKSGNTDAKAMVLEHAARRIRAMAAGILLEIHAVSSAEPDPQPVLQSEAHPKAVL